MEVKKVAHMVWRSSIEAEYRALASVISKLLWISQLLTDLHIYSIANYSFL